MTDILTDEISRLRRRKIYWQRRAKAAEAKLQRLWRERRAQRIVRHFRFLHPTRKHPKADLRRNGSRRCHRRDR